MVFSILPVVCSAEQSVLQNSNVLFSSLNEYVLGFLAFLHSTVLANTATPHNIIWETCTLTPTALDAHDDRGRGTMPVNFGHCRLFRGAQSPAATRFSVILYRVMTRCRTVNLNKYFGLRRSRGEAVHKAERF